MVRVHLGEQQALTPRGGGLPRARSADAVAVLLVVASASRLRSVLAGQMGRESAGPVAASIHGTSLHGSRWPSAPSVQSVVASLGACPGHEELASIYDEAVAEGHDVRFASDTVLVVFERQAWTSGGVMLVVSLGMLTAFLVPLVLFLCGAFAPGGWMRTYEVRDGGGVRHAVRRVRT